MARVSRFSRRSRTDIIASQFVEIRFSLVTGRARVEELVYERHVPWPELGFWHAPPAEPAALSCDQVPINRDCRGIESYGLFFSLSIQPSFLRENPYHRFPLPFFVRFLSSILMLMFFVLKKKKLEGIPFSNKIIRLSLSFFSFYVKLLWMERSFAIFLSKNRFPVLDRRSNISIGYYGSFIDANWEIKRVIKRRRDFFNPLELKRAKGVAKDTD